MIISKTPLRMSFVGGGSDLPSFYRRHGGAVISTAIDKYIYVNVNRKFDDGIRIAYSKTEEVSTIEQIEHKIVRSVLEFLGLSGGIEITTIADIPSRGTGLGSSSSFTVGLLLAAYAFLGRYASREQLGRESCHIEIDRCGEPIGKQDQYAAAFGGFNMIEFLPNDNVVVSPIVCEQRTVRAIEDSILVFYTGMTRSASELLRRQAQSLSDDTGKQGAMRRMVQLAYDLREELQDNNIDAFGELLHENWLLKKSMTKGISSSEIDDWYDVARSAGATGGKLLGAGAGGFMMFSAPPECHEEIRARLSRLHPVNVKFEPMGSQIIFYQN